MGLHLIYRAGEAELSVRFSGADLSTLSKLHQHLPDAIDALTDVPDFGVEIEASRSELLGAIAAIDRFLVKHPDALPHTYQISIEGLGSPGFFSTGAFSGFQLPGDTQHYYAIDAGLDVCQLEKRAVGPDGEGILVEKRDLRGQTILKTSKHGVIRIRKRRAKSSLRKGLVAIRGFLQSVQSDRVIRMLA